MTDRYLSANIVERYRQIEAYPQEYETLTKLLNHGENLYAVMDNGMRKFGVHLFSKSEFDEFYSQYFAGAYLNMKFYAVKPDGAK